MALSGSFTGSIVSGHYKLRVDWTATQSIANNTSTITAKMYIVNDWDLSIASRSDNTITIAGTTYKIASSAIRSKGTHYIGSATKTISHNSDGTKSGVSLSAVFNIRATIEGYGYYSTISASSTITLDTIPRASSVAVSNASADMGSAVTFTITRASTSFTHTLLLTWGGETSTIGSGIATSKEWTIPLSLASDLPNSESSGCIITCITYNGSTEIGRKTISMTLKVPASVKPTISSVTINEAVSGLASKFGAYIQNKSKLKVVTAASGSYSSTIKTYSVKILNKTYTGSTITSDVVSSSGSVNVAVTVTDSRGRTATTTKTVTVTAYSDPKITNFIAERCNSDGTLNDEGEYVKITYAFSVTSLSSKNDKTFTIGYKLKSDSEFTTLTSGAVYSANTTYTSTVVFNADNAYDFNIIVKDYFKSIAQIADIPTAFTLVDYHSSGKGLSFGVVADEENTVKNALELHQIANSYAFQAGAFSGDKGYTLMATIKLVELNVNAPIVFVLNKRGASCPMSVYIKFESSSATLDPDLESITYEGDNLGAFLVKKAASTWNLYVDNTSGWSNPCVQKWYTSDNQNARVAISFPNEQIAGTEPNVLGTYYRATPAKMQSILDYIYPVGSIYFSYSHVSPASMFGGTWTRLENAFLWASGETGTIGQTGGEKTHTLTVAEMPSHKHSITRPKWFGADGDGTISTQFGSSGAIYGYTGGTTASYKTLESYNNTSQTQNGIWKTGGDGAHNNMPPYIQVSAWRRTA